MAKIFNKTELIEIGKTLHDTRKKEELEIEDIAEISKLHYNTIKTMESGGNSTLNNFLSYCFALNLQPAEVIPRTFNINPKGKLSPLRLEKSRLTRRIHKLYEENYFNTWKYTGDVHKTLVEEYNLKSSTTTISVILSRMVADKKLVATKKGNKNTYIAASLT